jgi:hypothetical protein
LAEQTFPHAPADLYGSGDAAAKIAKFLVESGDD